MLKATTRRAYLSYIRVVLTYRRGIINIIKDTNNYV